MAHSDTELKETTIKLEVFPIQSSSDNETVQQETKNDLKVCRICLAMNVKLYPIKFYYEVYKNITGLLKPELEHKLPQFMCVECATRLDNCHKFINKSKRANTLLLDILENDEHLSIHNVTNIDRERHELISTLTLKVLRTNSHTSIKHQARVPTAKSNEKRRRIDLEVEDTCEEELKSEKEVSDGGFDSEDSIPIKKPDPKKRIRRLPAKKTTRLRKTVRVERKTVKKDPQLRKIDKRRKSFQSTLFTVTDLTIEEVKADMLKRQDTSNYRNAIFKCTECFKGFSNEDAYNGHKVLHTKQWGEHQCEICKIHFKHAQALRHHLWKRHKQRYSCKECPYTTSDRSNAKQHEKWHDGKQYKCPHCSQVFEKSTTYMSHVRIKHPSTFVCELCGFSFVSAKGKAHHKKLKHRLENQEIPADGPCCECCNVKFISDEAYKRHLFLTGKLTNTGEKKRWTNVDDVRIYPKKITSVAISCEQCGVQLKDSLAYHSHFRRMHPDKTRTNYPLMKSGLMCETCGRLFKTPGALEDHRWVHTNERPFACETCGKTFPTRQRVAIHFRQVHDEKRKTYVCEECGKQFPSDGNRKRHMIIHTGLKPFKCEMCGKGFSQATERKAHITYVHLKEPWPKRNRNRRRPELEQMDTT